MESLAVSEPKRLVIPRSSSFTDALRMVPLDTVARRFPDRRGSLRLARRGDLDLPRGNVLLDGVELALHRGRDLAVELVERSEAGSAIAEITGVVAGGDGPIGGLGDVLRHGVAEVLGHAGEEVLAVLRRALAAVGVDPHHADLATGRLGRGTRTKTSATGDREDDVRAGLDERLGDGLALVQVGERVGERAALLVLLVPAEHLDVLLLLLVVVLHALPEAVHVDRDRRDVQTTERGHGAGLRHGGGQVATEEATLRGVVLEAVDVRPARGRVDLGVLLLRVLRGDRLHRVTHEATDGDDGVAALVGLRGEVRGVVVLRARRHVGDVDVGVRLLRGFHAGPGRLVERTVVDATDVEHHARLELVAGAGAAAAPGAGAVAAAGARAVARLGATACEQQGGGADERGDLRGVTQGSSSLSGAARPPEIKRHPSTWAAGFRRTAADRHNPLSVGNTGRRPDRAGPGSGVQGGDHGGGEHLGPDADRPLVDVQVSAVQVVRRPAGGPRAQAAHRARDRLEVPREVLATQALRGRDRAVRSQH